MNSDCQRKYRLHWKQNLIYLFDFEISVSPVSIVSSRHHCTFLNCRMSVLNLTSSFLSFHLQAIFGCLFEWRLWSVHMISFSCLLSTWKSSLATSKCVCSNVCTSVLSLSISSSLKKSSTFLFASGIKSDLIRTTKKKFWITCLTSWVNTLPSNHTSKDFSHVFSSSRRQDTWETSDFYKSCCKMNGWK